MSHSKLPIIIDCDPGQDDAVNLFLALASPEELEVLGVTTVAGNVPVEKTERNARMVCELSGRRDIRVFSGADKPLLRSLVTAEHVHGEEGIDGIQMFEPSIELEEKEAVDFIVETLLEEGENSVTMVATGPLTNLGLALMKEPSIAANIHRVVVMGGASREGGNVTPSAESNIYVDPHAAEIVFGAGRPLVVMGLDVTYQVIATPERIAFIRENGNETSNLVANMLELYGGRNVEKFDAIGGPLHDPCTIAYLIKPELFRAKQVNIEVETESELTMGETVVDFWRVTNRDRNATWVYAVDAEGFFDLLVERLARLP